MERVRKVPELLAIDEEINRPYMTNPMMYNSQAWSRKLELPWVIAHIDQIKGSSILDVGSGFSSLPIFLSRKDANIVAIDPRSVRVLPDEKVIRIKAALPKLPFRDESFDVVSCVSVLEHMGSDISESFAELCRVARKRVIVTFDLALSPIAVVGLSSIEYRAFARMIKKHLIFPPDILTSPIKEQGSWGSKIGVCLLYIEKSVDGWPSLRLSKTQRMFIRIQRKIQNLAVRVRIYIRRLRQT